MLVFSLSFWLKKIDRRTTHVSKQKGRFLEARAAAQLVKKVRLMKVLEKLE